MRASSPSHIARVGSYALSTISSSSPGPSTLSSAVATAATPDG
jgi:hypothetical protein